MKLVAAIGIIGLLVLALAVVSPGAGLVQPDVPTDGTSMDARLTATGNADWTVTYRIELSSADREAAFEDLQADVAANESAYIDRFSERLGATVASAENATGRSMELQNVSVSTSSAGVSQSAGLLTYRFQWTNFARVDGERIEAGDALAGLFLEDETSLTIGWAEGYDRTRVTPTADERGDRSVTWRGPRDFANGEPRVVVQPGGGGLPAWLLGLGLLLALAAVGIGAVLWRRRDESTEPAPTEDTAASAEPTEDATADEPTEPPSELLSNEERVLQLLDAEGGRIKQQEIAERLEWTDAKTSQVIGDLRDDGTIETFRIGRENVVTLPDHEL